jgi:hypothetical protein
MVYRLNCLPVEVVHVFLFHFNSIRHPKLFKASFRDWQFSCGQQTTGLGPSRQPLQTPDDDRLPDHFVQRAGLIRTGQSHGMVSFGISARVKFHFGYGHTLDHQIGKVATELLPLGCRKAKQPPAAVLADQAG